MELGCNNFNYSGKTIKQTFFLKKKKKKSFYCCVFRYDVVQIYNCVSQLNKLFATEKCLYYTGI